MFGLAFAGPLVIEVPQLHHGGMDTGLSAAGWETLTQEQQGRWTTVLGHLAAAIPPDAPSVLVDGADRRTELLGERLAVVLRRAGRECEVCVRTGDALPEHLADPRLTIWVRSAPRHPNSRYGGSTADVVVDLHDPGWPVIRHLDAGLTPHDTWYQSETRAFFAIRATMWDAKFGDDLPAYAAAVGEALVPAGCLAVDVGCGTGRALPALRSAVGAEGAVIGVDLTPQMLAVARVRADRSRALLLLADARRLPLADGAAGAVFAAGLINHVPDPDAALRELGRVTRAGGRLILFHPSGRAALAARHGRTLDPDEPLAEVPLRRATARTGWDLTTYDDPAHRFLAIASRQ